MKLLYQKDAEIYNLKREVTDLKNNKLNKQEISDVLMNECKETISVSFNNYSFIYEKRISSFFFTSLSRLKISTHRNQK